ncbi:MAG: TIGR00266 family protein [Desulfobacterales bacterium]|nr:MAG: TIGR00266 family protein [Desulfobacterales bacterium]
MSQYNITLTGTLTEGTTDVAAINSLAKLLHLDKTQATDLFKQAPVTIKKSIDIHTAEQLRHALENAGIIVLVEPVNEEDTVNTAPKEIVSESRSADKAGLHGLQVTTSAPDTHGYHFKIEGRPDYAFLTVQMPAGSTLKVEAAAMASMSTNLVMKTKLRGGLNRLITAESIFINEYTAEGGPGEISIAPGPPGDMEHVYLDGDTIFLQNSAYVASDSNVEIETKWQGLVKGFFSGESLFLIRCSGKGDLWFNTYGAMIEIDVDGDYVVDTGNIVAFTEGLEYRISKVGGYKSLFLSGEGFVCRFSGKGRVWIQTRKTQAFIRWLWPFRPKSSKD